MYVVGVLFRDFNKHGSDIGPGTTARIDAALAWAAQHSSSVAIRFVTVGGKSPHQSVRKEPIAQLVANVLERRSRFPIQIDTRPTDWRTEAELAHFFEAVADDEIPVVVTAAYHLPRVRFLAKRLVTPEIQKKIVWVSTTDDQTTFYKVILEQLKFVYYCLPQRWQRWVYHWYVTHGLWIDRRH